jgi:Holliday junction resolvase RusA-like endonuclease
LIILKRISLRLRRISIPFLFELEPLYSLTVYGTPVAQGRARSALITSRKTGKQFISHYDPKDSRDYKSFIRKHIKKKGLPASLIDEPVILSCRVYILKPKSLRWGPKSKKEPVIFVSTKPDISNYIKGIEDSLEGLVLLNDSRIVGYRNTWKLYTDKLPRIEFELWKASDIWNR